MESSSFINNMTELLIIIFWLRRVLKLNCYFNKSKGGNEMLKKIIVILLFLIFLNLSAHEQQRAMNWCWASAIQCVTAHGGIQIRQVDIAARLDGWPQNRPASMPEVMALLTSYGIPSRIGGTGTPQQIYSTLSSGYKIIAFVKPSNNSQVGHYIVLLGFTPNGNVIIFDPWTGQRSVSSIQQLYYLWRWQASIIVG